jgi:hypothetical protein
VFMCFSFPFLVAFERYSSELCSLSEATTICWGGYHASMFTYWALSHVATLALLEPALLNLAPLHDLQREKEEKIASRRSIAPLWPKAPSYSA